MKTIFSVLTSTLLLLGCVNDVNVDNSSSNQQIKTDTASSEGTIETIRKLAAAPGCIAPDPRIGWRNRGSAPKAYIEGMALVFARSVCENSRPDVKIASSPYSSSPASAKYDALSSYYDTFTSKGFSNNISAVDTLRRTYTFLIGLGMMESSGRYCVGRDLSANFTTAESAEAGLFQTSWGVHRVDSTLEALFDQYNKSDRRCFSEVFTRNISCDAKDAITYGTGIGADWQRLTKACPAFATEYAAVVLRKSGGSAGEFGPVRKQQVEIIPACDSMLQKVQAYVESTPGACDALR